MAPRTHLFAAVRSETWGEVITALHLAEALHAAGDEVRFVAPKAMSPLFEHVPFRHGWIDPSLATLERALPSLARAERCDSVILVDLALVYMHLDELGRAPGFAARFGGRVLALDMWDLGPRARWDLGTTEWAPSPHAADVQRRLIPSPLARPDAPPRGAFAALPPAPAMPRAAARAALGLEHDHQLVVLPTAAWQEPATQRRAPCARLAASFPAYLALIAARLPARVRVAHVGPRAFPELEEVLGARYRWLDQRSRAGFGELLAAADLLLGFNASATSIGAAIAATVPVVLGTNARSGTFDEVIAGLAGPPSDGLRRWLERAAPMFPFRVWPLGLSRMLAPLLDDNPLLEAVTEVEILDEDKLVGACGAALDDAATRAATATAQRAFAASVRALPSALEVLRAHLA